MQSPRMRPFQLSIGKKSSNSPHELPALHPNALLHNILNSPSQQPSEAMKSARFVIPSPQFSGMKNMYAHFELSQACPVNTSQVGHLNLDSLELTLASVVWGPQGDRHAQLVTKSMTASLRKSNGCTMADWKY